MEYFINVEVFTLYIIWQIVDFSMSRDLLDDDYYVSHEEKIPVKWTAPEVS